MEPPRVPEKLVPVLAGEELAALLATCPNRNSLDDLRDTAIGAPVVHRHAPRRTHEPDPADVETNDRGGKAYVVGKGSRPRVVAFSEDAAESRIAT